ncbi:MAG: transcriptional regulator PpsR [Pseudomonadota bacterium]
MTAGGIANWAEGPMPVIEPEYLTGILAAACDLAFVVSSDGIVRSILIDDETKEHARLGHWAGKPMNNFLTVESIPKFETALEAVRVTKQITRPIELNHKDAKEWQYPVRYSFHTVGPDASVLMLGHDLRLVAEAQEQLVQAQFALERGYEERREFDARYRMLMASASDAFVFASASDGRIRDVNPAAARLLGAERDELIGAPLAQEFKHRRRGEFVEKLVSMAVSDFESEIQAQTSRSRRDVLITPTVFRAAGERLIICRLHSENTEAKSNERLLDTLVSLFHKSTDAIILTDTRGLVQDVNEAFLEIADLPSLSDVKGRSLSEFLQRGQIDLSVMLENAIRSGHMRVYATKLANEFGARASVEISVVYINDLDRPTVGFIVRDASRAETIRSTTKGRTYQDTANHNVVELVGSAPLKEIVAETNEVIERMCIETAVELTRNNRAAAAEMLGLSRQSLYVKLRKYDLLKRDDKE